MVSASSWRLRSALAGAIVLLGGGVAAASASPGLPFKSAGSGTEKSLSPDGCQYPQNGGSCTVESDGTATSSHMGTGPYTSVLTVDWLHYNFTTHCAPASGTGTITAANGDKLHQSDSGTVCETGTGAHTFTGTYTNNPTLSTGRFAGAGGGGTVTGGDDGAGHSYYSETGTITY